MKKYLIFPILFFTVDRIIKYFAPSISVEGDFLSFDFYKNYAGAFSLPIAGWLYNSAGITLLVVFAYLLYRELKSGRACCLLLTAYCFIIFGGLSNMIDRLVLGYTIDYVNFLDFSFFNIADGMLVLGIGVLLWTRFKKLKNFSQTDY